MSYYCLSEEGRKQKQHRVDYNILRKDKPNHPSFVRNGLGIT